MPAYNFQKRFAELVERGTKTHTIRKPRKRKTRVGEKLSLYTGQRTASCRLLRSTVVTRVVPILIECHINEWTGKLFASVEIEGVTLSSDELDTFAKSDGFSGADDFVKFWMDTYGLSPSNPQNMEVVHWR